MIIPEVVENLEFRYLYVKFFKWQDSFMNETVQGEPQTGRVYRSLWNTQTKNHKIIISDGHRVNSLVIDNLTNSNPESAYLSDIHELTVDNILNFKIEERDLDKLNKWIETKNEDILRHQKPMEDPTQGLVKLQEAIYNQDQEEFKAMDRASSAMLELFHANRTQFEIVVKLAEYLKSESLESGNDLAYYLTLHPQNGKGINIARALRALDTYVSDNRRTNESVSDLYNAMGGIVVEMERKLSNNLID